MAVLAGDVNNTGGTVKNGQTGAPNPWGTSDSDAALGLPVQIESAASAPTIPTLITAPYRPY